ncbi:hypothetical protein SAMN05421863_1007119 [Nitrosomonas communis]|uniref:Uncharacterized protein n=1 Tax=Nitrosomonas communis TaxID=44574 RepID=A0A1I4LVW1_9PROT|nr:hypothetical protein SAMN05421863_1007119 [Nitrosomonas communis]
MNFLWPVVITLDILLAIGSSSDKVIKILQIVDSAAPESRGFFTLLDFLCTGVLAHNQRTDKSARRYYCWLAIFMALAACFRMLLRCTATGRGRFIFGTTFAMCAGRRFIFILGATFAT